MKIDKRLIAPIAKISIDRELLESVLINVCDDRIESYITNAFIACKVTQKVTNTEQNFTVNIPKDVCKVLLKEKDTGFLIDKTSEDVYTIFSSVANIQIIQKEGLKRENIEKAIAEQEAKIEECEMRVSLTIMDQVAQMLKSLKVDKDRKLVIENFKNINRIMIDDADISIKIIFMKMI